MANENAISLGVYSAHVANKKELMALAREENDMEGTVESKAEYAREISEYRDLITDRLSSMQARLLVDNIVGSITSPFSS